jgi:hypothetical protein
MDPDEEVVSVPTVVNPAPLSGMGGLRGGARQLPGAPPSIASRGAPSVAPAAPLSINPDPIVPVILRISPAQEGEQFGHIYLTPDELLHQVAIQAYFDSAGREIMTLPCPDFEGFLTLNSLRTRNVSLLGDLPEYILRLGNKILEDNAYSSDGPPDLSWLPNSPSVTSPSLLTRGPTRPVPRPAHVTNRNRLPSSSPMSFRPNPDGIDGPTAPIFFSMGGSVSAGNFSPLPQQATSTPFKGEPLLSGITSSRNALRLRPPNCHPATLQSCLQSQQAR